MRINQYYFVEFGFTGNACFAFDENPIRFARNGSIAANTSGLKHRNHVARLIHNGHWEEQFEQDVFRLTGRQPTSATRAGLGVRAKEERSVTSSMTPRGERPLQCRRQITRHFAILGVQLRGFCREERP